jgi:TolA-binding protein
MNENNTRESIRSPHFTDVLQQTYLQQTDAVPHFGMPLALDVIPARSHLPLLSALLVAAALFAAPRAAAAQQMDSTYVERFQLADTFLRAGQFDRAIVLLEDLFAADPDSYAFYAKLKEAYEGVKRYDDAVELVQGRLSTSPNASLQSDLARLYYLQNDGERAYDAWDEAIATDPAEPTTYRVVYQSLLDVRQFDRAIDVLVKAREATGRPELFRPDLAYLNSLTGRHGEAMAEYLGMLGENQQQLGFIRSRLSRFVEQEEALRASIAATERAVRNEPLNRAYRELLGWLYVEAEDYPNAFAAYRAIDRLESEDGQVLFQFARMAADAAAYDIAAEGFQEVLARHPSAPSAPQALSALGEMHERWAEQSAERAYDDLGNRVEAVHYDEALATYRAFLQRHPNHDLYPEVLGRIGRLQQDVFFDLGSAEATLEQVVARYPETRASAEAAFNLARTSLMRGRLAEARLRFSRLVDRLRTGDLAENARYELARIHLFAGEFDAAASLVDVIDANTSADVSNDAIELKLLLMENRGPDSLDAPLHSYAEALFAREQRQAEAALDTVSRLLETYPAHALADDARYLRAEILRSMGRTEEAYQVFAEFPLLHPRSHLADEALFAAGDIQQHEMADEELAVDTYQKLLSEYPGSLLAGQARARIRRLRGDGV